MAMGSWIRIRVYKQDLCSFSKSGSVTPDFGADFLFVGVLTGQVLPLQFKPGMRNRGSDFFFHGFGSGWKKNTDPDPA